MNDGEWLAIATGSGSGYASGNRINQVLPSPNPNSGLSGEGAAAICTAWTGGCVDQRRGEYILCANGGHADYPGNEAYALNLRGDTPGWRRLSDPTPNGSMGSTTAEGGGLYADGRPRAMHSTFECYGDGRVWFPMMNSVTSGGGGSVFRRIAYNRDLLGAAASPVAYSTNPWEDFGTFDPVTGGFGTDGTAMIFGVCAFDRIGHKVWALGGNSANISTYWSVDTIGPTKGAVQGYNSGQSIGHWGGWVVVAWDLRILVAGDHLRNKICVLDLTNPSAGWQEVSSESGTAFYASGSGGAYVMQNNSIAIGLPRDIGRTIYKLVIPTTTSGGKRVYNSAGTWVWTTLSPSGPTMSVAAGNSGAYTKWNIVENMGNGRSALVYVGDIAAGTYVYKIPAAGL